MSGSSLRAAAAALTAGAALALAVGALAAAPARPAAAPVARAAAASAWTVDKAASKIRFRSAFSGAAFEGGFGRWDAQIAFDPKNLAASKAVVTVDLASASTGDADRDQTLPTDEWFNVGKFPKATYATTAIKDLGAGKYQASGTLTLKGVSRPVVLNFTLAIQGDVARMTGQAVLNRSQFAVGQGQFAAADTVPYEVTVPISVVARRAK